MRICLWMTIVCLAIRSDKPSNSGTTATENDHIDSGSTEMQSLVESNGAGNTAVQANSKAFWDTTPLFRSIIDRNEEQFKQLLDEGANPNEWDKYGRNAVTVAADVPNSQLWIQHLLAHGGDPDARAPESIKAVPLLGGGFAPLHIAASEEDCMINVRLLVEAGADVNATNAYGMTPLALAVDSGLFEVAIYLVEHGANPNVKCTGGFSVRETLDYIVSDDYGSVLSSEDADSLKYLREQIAALDSE